MPTIAPSILGADFGHLAEEVAGAESSGVSMLHLDIMDGHFVPNISFGPGIVRTIDRLTNLYLDVHLMLSEPERYFKAFVEAGADRITFHLEVHPEPTSVVHELRKLGVEAGISLNPDMPIERVLPYLKEFDLLLIMSVFPGFGGQEFIPASLSRIRAARDYIDSHGLRTQISVDGGVDRSTAGAVLDAGADILVMGTGFFKESDRRTLIASVLRT